MLKITVEGNKKEIMKAKSELSGCCFIDKDCDLGADCKKCEKGRVEIKYVVKED